MINSEIITQLWISEILTFNCLKLKKVLKIDKICNAQ